MTLSMYQASVPVLLRQLGTLSGIMAKGEAHAAAKSIDPAVMLAAQLAPDMLPLSAQVQRASDAAKGGAARLAGTEPPSFADDEVTFADLQARIAKTIAYLETVTPAQVDGSEDRAIVLKAGPREFNFTGQSFLLTFVLPNFFFHYTTAYALLRHQGVEIGKIDYLGGV